MADWSAVEVSIGELIANACTDACQESLRRLFHRYTHDLNVYIYMYVYICDIVIVGGLIKACYAASRPSSQTRRRFNIYENYPIVSNIVGDRGSMRHVRMMSFKDRCAIILRRVSSPVYAPGACLHALLWVIS